MLLIALALTAAADPGDRPEVGDDVRISVRPLAADGPDGWRRGEALVALGDGVLVRAEPDLDSPAIATLAVGAVVTLRERPTPHEVDDVTRPDRWLAVQAGDVSGWTRHAGVTAAGWETDLDGDGVEDVVTAGFNGGGELVVRVLSGGQTHTHNLGTRSDIEGVQDDARVRIMPASEAGIPLVHANWSAREQCGSGDSSAYVSFVPAKAGEPSVLREALHHNGSGGDAPIWWDTTATFDPASQAVVVHSRAGEDDDDGNESIHHDESKAYDLVGGVFVERGVVQPGDAPVSPPR
jgi:hypothetical protein